ncbi:STY4528 family pathogenicity island replication protein [Methylomonas sp. MgM2]
MTSISDSVLQLAQQIAKELAQLRIDTATQGKNHDSLLYIGQWQDAIPRAIWCDRHLEAIDVRCWGLIRTQAMTGSAVILSLHRLLQSQLGISKPTASKVLYVLRLTRWISLCSELRNEAGQFKGHIYAIHDSPLAVTDALYLDPHYLTFVEQQCQHQHSQIRHLSQILWQSIHYSITNEAGFFDEEEGQGIVNDFFRQVNGQSRNQNFTPLHRVNLFNSAEEPDKKLNPAPKSQVKKMNLAKNDQVKIFNPALNQEESNEKQSVSDMVNYFDRRLPITTTRSSSLNKTTTTTDSANQTKNLTAQAYQSLIYPPDFNASERELAKHYLQQVAPELQQMILDETAAQIQAKRTSNKPIRNPVAYLAWLCHEQAKGNPVLTSLSVRCRHNRERKQQTEQQVRQKQQELAAQSESTTSTSTRPSGKAGQEKPTQQLREALNNTRKHN